MATHAFKRPESNCIAQVLQSLDAELLDRCKCFFGGGAAIALALGEFRQSIGIDFWVSDMEGYRELKERMTSENEFASILKPGMYIEQVRPVRPNQFGVATMLRVDGMPIKFEVLLEFRGGLSFASSSTQICGVHTLNPVDMLATKLTANADRWRRDEAFNRDLIDMAMMQPTSEVMAQAMSKIRQTTIYRDICEPNLGKAITRMQERDGWLATCLEQLHVTVPQAAVLQFIKNLELSAVER